MKYLISITLCIISQLGWSQPFDSTFGTNGIVIMPYDIPQVNNNDKIVALKQLPDNKIISVDIYNRLVRYHINGKIDSTFAINGRTPDRTIGSYAGSYSTCIALQTDGKMVVGGHSSDPQTGPNYANDITVLRFNANGSLDTTFNHNGEYAINVQGTLPMHDYCNDIAVQYDGKILVAGASGGQFMMMRLLPNGLLDSSFATNGIYLQKVGQYGEELSSILVRSDGKINVGGTARYGTGLGGDKFCVLQFKPNGSLDSNWGVNGLSQFDFNESGTLYEIAYQRNGKIVVVGRDVFSGGLLACLDINGHLDNTFGAGGKVNITNTNGIVGAEAVTTTQDGSIFLSGHVYVSGQDNIYILKLHSDGSIDAAYSPQGYIIKPVGYEGRINSVLCQSDGKILIGGYVDDGSSIQYCMMRFKPFPVNVSDVTEAMPFTFYPNPCTTSFTCALPMAAQLDLYSPIGRHLLRSSLEPGENNISINNVPIEPYYIITIATSKSILSSILLRTN